MAAHDRRIVAERAAQAGADVAAASFRRPLEVETKSGPTDLVTEVDRNAQEAVVEVIRSADPDGVVVAEEDGLDGTVPAEGTAWIVDPIDGTGNYVAGSRLWATSVATVVDGEAVAAATLMPAYGDEYALGPERVTRSGGPVSPSEREDPATFTVSPLGVPRGGRERFAALCDVLLERTGDLRRLGCAQAALAMVASGELDAVVATRSLDPWDTVAGAAMVERAGGVVTDAQGDPWHPHADGLVASNGRAHDALVAAARDPAD